MAMSGAELARAYAGLLSKGSHHRYDTSGQHGMNIYQDTYHFSSDYTVLVSMAFKQLVADPESAPLLALGGWNETLRDCAKIWLESNIMTVPPLLGTDDLGREIHNVTIT